jgi:hypothetical protein
MYRKTGSKDCETLKSKSSKRMASPRRVLLEALKEQVRFQESAKQDVGHDINQRFTRAQRE